MPVFVVYCSICGTPPEYCDWISRDAAKCKEVLEQKSPALFSELYGEGAPVEDEDE